MALFFIGNTGVNLMVIVISFLSFFEIFKLSKSKVKLHYHITFLIILYFFITNSGLLNLFDHLLLIIFYTLSSLIIIGSLFQKSNIHFSILGFLLNSTFFSIMYIITNQNLEYKLIFIIITIVWLYNLT